MQYSPRFLNYTTDRVRRHQRLKVTEGSIIPTRSDQTNAVAGASNLLPVGLAVVVTTVANGLLSADLKARLVFCDGKHALPGHRAFSVYAKKDPRIDFVRLQRALGNKLPRVRPSWRRSGQAHAK
jgi:hypothetical protein